jgi:phosphoglycerate dehydrogenase-like enzyme
MPKLPTRKILVPNSIDWTLPALPLEVVRFNPADPIPPAALECDALLAWNTPRKVLHTLIGTMPALRWIQAISAGVDHILSGPLTDNTIVSNGKGLHDAPTAEIALALLMSAARGMHLYRDAQRRAEWDRSAYQNQLLGRAPFLGTLEGARVLILGMGSIGLEIAKRVSTFGAHVEGVATTAGVREGYVTHAFSSLETLLPDVDALVMVLPDTPETHGILSRERIALMHPKSWVVNVGRGSAIDEAALIEALERGRLGGAALDVTAREPLPTDSKLWSLENVVLTPHIGGGGPRFYEKANALLVRNAQHFLRGEPLENIVSREKGY